MIAPSQNGAFALPPRVIGPVAVGPVKYVPPPPSAPTSPTPPVLPQPNWPGVPAASTPPAQQSVIPTAPSTTQLASELNNPEVTEYQEPQSLITTPSPATIGSIVPLATNPMPAALSPTPFLGLDGNTVILIFLAVIAVIVFMVST